MKRSGSVTVFFVLLLVFMTSAIFAFLEVARVNGLHVQARLCTRQAADTIRASYEPGLWKQYHVLFWREPDGGAQGFVKMNLRQKEQIEQNWKLHKKEVNFFVLPVHIQSVDVKKYELATDHYGENFKKQAAMWMRQSLTEDAIREVWKVVTGADEKQLEQNGAESEAEVEHVLEELEGDRSEQKEPVLEDHTGTGTGPANDALLQENPLEWVKKIKQKGILSVVIPEKEVSSHKIDRSDCLEYRRLHQGNWEVEKEQEKWDSILFQLYCKAHFSDATQKKEADRSLEYEMEYLIGGKNSDIENLKTTVNRLLFLREGANLVYLEGNPEKSQEAFQIALAITSAAANPALAEPVKQAVLAAWAYAESVCDVRILLNGGKIPLVKTDAQWHTDLQNLQSCMQKTDYEQEQTGLSYAGYLQILLKTTGEKKLVFRAMDLIEKELNLRMDEMVSKTESVYIYETNALFWNFVQIGNTDLHKLQVQEQGRMSFCP